MLADKDVLLSAINPKEYSSQTLTKFLDVDDEKLIQDLGSSLNDDLGRGTARLSKSNYNKKDGTFELKCHHKRRRIQDITIFGVIRSGKCFTEPLILPNLPSDDPAATVNNSLEKAKQNDPVFRRAIKEAAIKAVYDYQEKKFEELFSELEPLPSCVRSKHLEDLQTLIKKAVPIQAIRQETETMLWHQRLGHIHGEALANAHRHIDGVPKLSRCDSVIYNCPTCIQAKMTKSSAGPNSTRTATRPYQGLSIDFSFSGVESSKKDREDFVGFNGETSWILVSDHFSKILHGTPRLSKAAPVEWLREFLNIYSPQCKNKYVFLDQGGELYQSPDIRNLFKKYGYEIRVTGADTSRQNAPVERAHRTVADGIRALLIGSNVPIRFWPFAFTHFLRIRNSFPGADQDKSPFEICLNKKDNFLNFRTFGARVWVRPPGKRRRKFKKFIRKGIFLGYTGQTQRNFIWYDVNTERVKIASHGRFDEGFNDLPIESIPPNVQQLTRSAFGKRYKKDPKELTSCDLQFYLEPFAEVVKKNINRSCEHPQVGMQLATDPLYQRVYVSDFEKGNSSDKICSSYKATCRKFRGAFITEIQGTPIFSEEDALNRLQELKEQGVRKFSISFAPERKLDTKTFRRNMNEYHLFAPNTKGFPKRSSSKDEDTEAGRVAMTLDNLQLNTLGCLVPTEDCFEEHVVPLNIETIRAISSVKFGSDMDEDEVPTEVLNTAIHTLSSKSMTPEEEALGAFTRSKLKKLQTWEEWATAERKQIDQFHDLGMYGNAIAPEAMLPNAVVLRPHWQYAVKRDGTRRSRQCCDGSERAAPKLRQMVSTWSSCVELPIQRLFLGIAASKSLKLYGGDAKDAYAHSPASETPTYLSIDNQYADWYKHKYKKDIDRRKVLPIKRALQGHPESGKQWMHHIDKILVKIGFLKAKHDHSIYKMEHSEGTIYLLRQVDDFVLACRYESTSVDLYNQIGLALQRPVEKEKNFIPFTQLGVVNDFNGIDIHQCKDYIEISSESYIDRLLKTHGWDTPSNKSKDPQRPLTPIPPTGIDAMFTQIGPLEHTVEHAVLEKSNNFKYRTLLGELMYAYVTCRPDIGYGVTTLSKFASRPSQVHYTYLKGLAKYLRSTKKWGIRFHRPSTMHDDDLEPGWWPEIKMPEDLNHFPVNINNAELNCFVDAAHANDLTKRRSTTGFVFTFAGGAVLYRTRTQSICATSSTEAEFIAAVDAAKNAKYLRQVLMQLGIPQDSPTPIYSDNESAIRIVNDNRMPTDRIRHIDIRWFAIQDWKENNEIILKHIPGILQPSDAQTKPLGWVLHSRHCHRMMGHFQ